MSIEVLVAYSKSESELANNLIVPITDAGFAVWHRDSVLTGNSITEEASKALDQRGPVVVCATAQAVGAKWTRRIINAARERGKKVFIVQMDEEADVDSISLGETVANYYVDPTKAIDDLILAIKSNYSLQIDKNENDVVQIAELESRYSEIALKSFDIIDLTNLPDTDKNILTKRLELRQLYVPLRLKSQIESDNEAYDPRLIALEGDNIDLTSDSFLKQKEMLKKAPRISLGESLDESRQLVILGDPGSGKTTLLRWLSTAYLLYQKESPEVEFFPDINTLPKENWIPLIIRCRTVNELKDLRSHEDLFRASLQQSEIFSSDEIPQLVKLFQNKLKTGNLILLIDGLDEITEIKKRAQFCEQIESIKIAYPQTPIIVTSRIVGYREAGHRLRGFDHYTVDELTKNDKDTFAMNWCRLTEVPERKKAAAKELIEDIHSSDRIEKLTGNPMLLTTVALVKQKVGRLPSRRVDLYWDAFEVLLNWRSLVDKPIHWREALPQLSYIAFEMNKRGIQRLRQDEVLELLEQVRDEHPNNNDINRDSPENFLNRLEKRTGILIQLGFESYLGINYPVYEFRHLTFQEYLAARALIDRYYPKYRDQKLSDKIAPLAGQFIQGINEISLKEESVGENWSETLRLCVSACRDEDVDDVLISILEPLATENREITQRPRISIAALCLAEEPNCSPKTAERIIESLVRVVRDSKTKSDDIIANRVDTAIKSLSKTKWVRFLKSHLYLQLFERAVNDRTYIAKLYAIIIGKNLPNNSYNLIQWLRDQLIHFELDSKDKKIEAALALRYLASNKGSKKIEFIPDLISKFIDMLEADAVSAHIAASTLHELNRDTLSESAWRPNKNELKRILTYVSNYDLDPGCTRNLISILERENLLPAIPVILDRIENKNNLIEIACINAIGHFGDKDNSKYIIPFLDDKRKAVRMASIYCLGKLKDKNTIKALLDKLNDPDEEISAAIIETLSEIDGANLADTFKAFLNDPKPKIRSNALSALKSINLPEFKSIVLEKTKDTNNLVRGNAIQLLMGLSSQNDFDIVEKYMSDEDESVRINASIRLLLFDISLTEQLFIKALENDSSLMVQIFATFALAKSKNKEIYEILIKIILNGDKALKLSAARLLNKKINENHPTELLTPLFEKLRDKDNEDIPILLFALKGVKNDSFINQLSDFLDHKSSQVRTAAIDAIGESGRIDFVPALIRKLKDDESKVRQAAITALGVLKANIAEKELIGSLGDESLKVRFTAASVLGDLKRFRAEEALLKALDDEHNHVRYCAVKALGKIKSKKAIEIFLDKVSWESSNVELEIISTLGEFGDLRAYDTLFKLLNDDNETIRLSAADSFSSLAYRVYDTGDIEKSLTMFESCLQVKATPLWTTNVVFCALILNKHDVAGKYIESLDFSKDNSNFVLNMNNKAIYNYLNSNKKVAINLIEEAIKWIDGVKDRIKFDIYALLILKSEKPTAYSNIPIDAALLLNLYAFQGISKQNLVEKLSQKYPTETESWVKEFVS